MSNKAFFIDVYCVSEVGHILRIVQKINMSLKKRFFEVKIKAAHFSRNYINITTVYISQFCLISCICWRRFISDHVLKVAAGLAISSSSMNYVFLPKRGLRCQQCQAGKLLLSGSCISFSIVCVFVRPSYETVGILPTSMCWTEIRSIKEALNENVSGMTHCSLGPLCTGKHSSGSHKNVLAHLWRGCE